MDEDEAKSIASAWVRRLEANVLSKVHDNKPHEHRHQNENTVTNAYRDDRLPRSYPPPSPKEKIHSDSTKISATSNLVDLKDDTKTNSILTSLERKPSKEQPLNQPSRNSPRTPRIDLDVLRNKRLRHFQNNDSYAVTNGEKEGQNFSESLGSSLQSDSCASSMLQWEPNSCERLEGNSFNGESWNYNSYSNGLNTQRSDDDDKLRLELWGLRGAVESGQLDINSYLRPARSTDIRQNNINSSNLVNTQNPEDDYSKLSSSRDNNYNFTLLKKVNKKGDFPIMNSAEGNLHLMTSMLTIQAPQEGGEGPDNANAEQDSEEFSLSDLQPSTSFGGAIPQTKQLHKAKEDFTRFSVAKNHPAAPFGGTIPQIEGKLYNGFETSDSESSVNAMSIQNKNRSKSKADMHTTKSNKPLKSGKGKQKILNELTEYLDAGRGNKKLNLHHKVESSPKIPHSDKEDVRENHPSTEILLKSSSPIAVHKNGFRSRSISPDNHRYISTSAPITYNGVLNGSPDDGIGRNAIYGEEEPRFGSLKTQVFDHHIPLLAKSCPTCNEVNSQAANWCIECGTALIAIQPTILSQEQREDYEEQRQEAKKLINEVLDCRSNSQSLTTLSKTERELNQDIINLSKEVDKNAGFSNKSLQSNLSSYKRRWLKSSTAWSTYEPQELSKPSSIVKPGKNNEKKNLMKNKESFMDGALRSRSSSDLAVIENSKRKNKVKNGFKSGRRQRTTSATYHSADDYDSANLSINLELTNQKSPGGSKSANHTRPRSAKPRKEKVSNGNRPGSARPLFKSPSPLSFEKENAGSPSKKATSSSGVGVPQLNLDDLGSYDRILTLIRSQRDSEPVPYLYLPDEIILEIFSSLSNKDLVSCACVCSQFNRIAMDETLWKTIVIRKNRNICDDWLESIGDRRPSSLTITQCSTNKVSSEGLRRLFRKCSESLEEVDFSGCSGGELIGESILLHISVRCFNVVSVDISWTNVSDNGIQELAKNLKRLESLCLNGCQAVTDKSLTAVAKQHGESLRIFEVFGCFNITPAGLMLFGSQCRHLQTLNIGQCHKMTDSAVGNLVSHLPEIENLDLRGCKQTRDSAVKKIVRHCPHLKSLVLANCPLITDATLSEISTNLAEIKSLDICGCSLITDAGVRALARNCHKLELLDLSSTGTAVTSKSIVALSNYCSQSLRVLKLSFCSDISVNTVNQVVKNCKKLNLLHLYGCKRIKELDKIKNINQNLVIER